MAGGLARWTGTEWEMLDLTAAARGVSISALDFDPGGLVWAASDLGALSGLPSDWRLHPWPTEMSAPVGDALYAPEGVVYFASENGLLRFRDAMALQIIGGGR
jgi:hypothetical protein